jgi:hypothetical protein
MTCGWKLGNSDHRVTTKISQKKFEKISQKNSKKNLLKINKLIKKRKKLILKELFSRGGGGVWCTQQHVVGCEYSCTISDD